MTKITTILTLFCTLFAISCTEKTIYSGKIINQANIDYSIIKNKNQLINELGKPSYIDPIEDKYFYYSEKKIYKNFFDKKTISRILLVFEFNLEEKIKSIDLYNLEDEKDIIIVKEKTKNNLIERGLIEKIFGGVGKTPELPINPYIIKIYKLIIKERLYLLS